MTYDYRGMQYTLGDMRRNLDILADRKGRLLEDLMNINQELSLINDSIIEGQKWLKDNSDAMQAHTN